MKLSARIDHDCRCMESYFHKLFQLLEDSVVEEYAALVEVVDTFADESQASFHHVSHLIKPDMLINIYSLVDYWLNEVCKYQSKSKNIDLKIKKGKGINDLEARHKYLTEFANVDFGVVSNSFERLNELRIVRNKFIHSGGYIPETQLNEFESIEGIDIFNSLIEIDENFIWSQLDHARKYLVAGVQA